MSLEKQPFYKQKNVAIDPEDVDPKMLYALTICPESQYDDTKNSTYLKRPEYVMSVIVNKLEHGKESFNYYLLPESKNGRIHAHGYLQITDPLHFDIFVLPLWKAFCTYYIKSSDSGWYTYCTKQCKLWSTVEFNLKVVKRSIKLIDIINHNDTHDVSHKNSQLTGA